MNDMNKQKMSALLTKFLAASPEEQSKLFTASFQEFLTLINEMDKEDEKNHRRIMAVHGLVGKVLDLEGKMLEALKELGAAYDEFKAMGVEEHKD